MTTFKQFITDLFNGFAIADIPLLLFQLFLASFLGWAVLKLVRPETNDPVFVSPPLLAGIMAMLTATVKYSVPLSIALVAVAVFCSSLFQKSENKKNNLVLFLAALSGFGCGSGFVAITIIGFAVIVFPLLWLDKK